jgi:Tfp pilus assembly protein PilX
MKKEQGFVSILVASLLIVILSLIVLGFNQIMLREQRQVLDRQLSSQAFYAAETAVNDVYEKLKKNELPAAEKTTCDVTNWPSEGRNGRINDSSGAAYTCITYDQTPASLIFSNGSISTQESKIFQIQNATGGNIRSVTFEWSGEGSNKSILSNTCANQELPPTMTNRVPLLRVELTRLPLSTNAADTFNRQSLIDNTTYFYLYPKSGCGTNAVSYGLYTATAQKGPLLDVNCSTSAAYACSFTLSDIDAANPSDRYIARVKSIYNNADMRVTATGSSGASFQFLNAQVQVDATGKAGDVLRRINVSLGSPNFPIPEYGLFSMDGICKDLQVAPAPADPLIAQYGCN